MQNIIWVIGCPRSGTSFITDFIGMHTDYCFNEPWDTYPLGNHKNWNLPNGSITFKYCSNAFYYKEIKSIYNNSQWIHIIRDPFFCFLFNVFP